MSRMKSYPTLSLLLAISASALPSLGSSLDNTGIVLRDHHITAIIRPDWGGRIMSICADGTNNLLWVNQQVETLMWGWRNYGGDKTWIGPQESWKPTTGLNWPPPLSFDYAPFTVTTQTVNAVSMRSAIDTNWNFAVERTVRVDQGKIVVTSSLVSPEPEAKHPDGRMTSWAVAQIPLSPRVWVRMINSKRYHNGFLDSPKLPDPQPLGTNKDCLLFDLTGLGSNGKCFFDADAFLVEVPGGYLSIVQTDCDYLGDGTNGIPERAQFFVGSRKDLPPEYEAYMEIEFAMPYPKSRQTITYSFIPHDHHDNPEELVGLLVP